MDGIALASVISSALVGIGGLASGHAGRRHTDRLWERSQRQERARWQLDKRAELYVELLTEAHADLQDFKINVAVGDAADDTEEFVTANPADELHIRERFREQRDAILAAHRDTHLPARARALLGVRVGAHASPEVHYAWNAFCGAALRAALLGPRDRPGRVRARFEVQSLFNALNEMIIGELNPDAGKALSSAGESNRPRAGGSDEPHKPAAS